MENNQKINCLTINFEKKEEIGQNGYNSRVFKAYEVNLQRIIAIKQIQKKDLKTNFYEEAILLNESQHPNVVNIHYAGEGKEVNEDGSESEYVYLAMPLYKNGSLKEVIQKENTLKQLLKYVFGILNGLLHIHTKGILHLDLKPDNILISDKGDALITDFGVATHFDIETSFTKNKKSTLLFLNAPETVVRKEVAIQSDIYQIGILFYLLFNKIDMKEIQKKFDLSNKDTRKAVVEKIREAILNDELYPKIFAEHIPSKIKDILLKCMAINSNDRYRSIEEVRNEFALIIDNNQLLWKYNLNPNGEKIWTRNIDSTEEKCILKTNGEIIYKKTKKEKIIDEKILLTDLNVFFNEI